MSTRGRGRPAESAPSELTLHRFGFGRERLVEIQRARLLGAMAEVTSERGGGAGVTVAHVVERAGVSRRTFYELFDDREECSLAASEEAVARASRLVLDAYDPSAKWEARIRVSLVTLLLFLDTERAVGRLLIVGSLGSGDRTLELRKRVIAQLIAIVDEGRGESKAREELPPLTAEGVVGGVLAVLHSRLLEDSDSSMLALTSPLMSMIVLPYLGAAAARKELAQPAPERSVRQRVGPADPLRDVDMRLTYRTVRVLMAVAELGARGSDPSNREVGAEAGMTDQGQTSRLLSRMHRLGLIENTGDGPAKGGPNAWRLTLRGAEVERALGQRGTAQSAN